MLEVGLGTTPVSPIEHTFSNISTTTSLAGCVAQGQTTGFWVPDIITSLTTKKKYHWSIFSSKAIPYFSCFFFPIPWMGINDGVSLCREVAYLAPPIQVVLQLLHVSIEKCHGEKLLVKWEGTCEGTLPQNDNGKQVPNGFWSNKFLMSGDDSLFSMPVLK